VDYSNFDQYQRFAESTAIYPPERGLFYTALGLCGESGEAAEVVKKLFRDDDGTGPIPGFTEERREKLKGELGDVAWYLANLAREAGIPLSEVIKFNIEKLSRRLEEDKLKGDGSDR
jgi:NTP pyrophosphatase (non-canonical NTP hydrolase)